MPSAVIVRARLPAGLERLRRASVQDAADGVPAHLTLLYPFVEPDQLGPALRQTLAGVASRHRRFDFRLRGMARWPDTVYVAVSPAQAFVRLQRDLQAAFPGYPIYGRDATFRFVPHVTIAEGWPASSLALRANPAWRALPQPAHAAAIEVIATGADGRWRLVWRIPLPGGGPGARRGVPRAADRMRP
jgi:2'-5' RNA ligase